MLKTHTLFDAIGIRQEMDKNLENAAKLLEQFWKAAASWTSQTEFGYRRVEGQAGETVPAVYVSTFSDSALMYTEPEVCIDEYYELVEGLKEALNRVVSVYAIVSRGEEIGEPDDVVLKSVASEPSGRPHYIQIAGSGAAWTHLHRADQIVKQAKEWHGTFSLYCVGDRSRPESLEC